MLSPTYKQRNEDFRKLFKQLPDTERLIVGELGDLACGGRRAIRLLLSTGSPSKSICLGIGSEDAQRAGPSGGDSGLSPTCVMASREPGLGGIAATLVPADGLAEEGLGKLWRGRGVG